MPMEMITQIPISKPPMNELAHFGVKGMRWGHHKRVDESASIKKARKSVEQTKAKLKLEKKKYNKATAYGNIPPSKEVLKSFNDATREHRYSLEDLSTAKVLDKISRKEKSKHQLDLESKYKQKGMTDDEAAVAAYKHIRTKRILMTAGAITLTAAAAYGGYKLHDARADKLIKAGTSLQNISTDSTKGVRDAFYASTNKFDNVKYRGFYGGQLAGGADVYQKQIKTLTDMKQVSPKNAHAIMSDLAKNDPEFMSGLKDIFKFNADNPNRFGNEFAVKFAAAEKNLSKGVIDKKTYELFNVALVDHSEGQQKLTNKFFETLSSKGYNAIRDVNDNKFSGYKTLNPIITFGASGKLDVTTVEKLTAGQIQKANAAGTKLLVYPELIKTGAKAAAAITAYKGAKSAMINSMNNKVVSNYRNEHPNTKLSNTEIVRLVERSK